MPVTTYTSPMNAWAATDAGFRAWGETWTDMLDTLGLTQVYSDIDWTTVTMPTTATTYAGKRVYSINDALSSTREVFIAVEFGRGSTTTASFGFAIRVTVGTAHSAGTVSNYAMQHFFTMTQSPSDGGDIIGVKSDLGFCVWTNLNAGSAYQAGFALERLAVSGTPSADGVVMMLSGQACDVTGTYSGQALFRVANYDGGQVFAKVGGYAGSSTNPQFTNVQAIPDSSDPSYAGKAPAITMDTFGKYDPCMHWIGVSKYLYSPATEFTATINGVTGAYRTPVSGFLLDHGTLANSKAYVAVRVG